VQTTALPFVQLVTGIDLAEIDHGALRERRGFVEREPPAANVCLERLHRVEV
jgi:hypothetical protein